MDEPKPNNSDHDLAVADTGEALPPLQQISIREIIALQSVIALIVFIDFKVLSTPTGIVLFPMVAALWSAFRLRHFRRVTYVNPFSFTIFATTVTHVIYSLLWPEANAYGAGPLEILVTAIVTGIAYGGVSAFLALVALNYWTSPVKHKE